LISKKKQVQGSKKGLSSPFFFIAEVVFTIELKLETDIPVKAVGCG
jgi:hypothetical protein